MENGRHVPPQSLRQQVENATGRRSVRWTRPDCGLSATHRFSVQFEDGSKVFVKAATDDATEQWLRREHLALATVATSFMPDMVAWLDEPGHRPVLLSEDLSAARWPASHAGVTWREGDFDLLFAGIAEISACAGLEALPALTNAAAPRWVEIARHPEPFLDLQLCSAAWLDQAAEALAEAEQGVDLSGRSLIHGDIRSDNVCLAKSRAVFVDWSNAARGNGMHNLAGVLATLHLEGGPLPFDVMPDGGGWAAMDSASLAVRMVEDTTAPVWLTKVFKRLIVINLGWAASALGLPQPDGPAWTRL
jgi:hypothetical protein